MSFLGTLSQLMGNIGRGAEDVFTLGGTELARKYGGQGAKNVLNPLGTALGSNFTAGAVGGSGILGAQAAGMGGASAMSPYMASSTPGISTAGSSEMGIGSPLGLTPAYGSATGAAAGSPVASAAGASPVSSALNYMRLANLPGGGGQQSAAPQQNALQRLAMIYKMFPNLSPFKSLGGSNG